MTISKAERIKQIKHHRRHWTKALENETFGQARGKLRSNRGNFCVLGVAQLLFGLETEVVGDHEELTDESCSALGLNMQQHNILIDKNDKSRWTFPQLAQLIREMPISLKFD